MPRGATRRDGLRRSSPTIPTPARQEMAGSGRFAQVVAHGLLLRRGNGAELVQQAEPVYFVPALHDLAAGDAIDVRLRHRDARTGWGHAPELTLVGGLPGQARD